MPQKVAKNLTYKTMKKKVFLIMPLGIHCMRNNAINSFMAYTAIKNLKKEFKSKSKYYPIDEVLDLFQGGITRGQLVGGINQGIFNYREKDDAIKLRNWRKILKENYNDEELNEMNLYHLDKKWYVEREKLVLDKELKANGALRSNKILIAVIVTILMSRYKCCQETIGKMLGLCRASTNGLLQNPEAEKLYKKRESYTRAGGSIIPNLVEGAKETIRKSKVQHKIAIFGNGTIYCREANFYQAKKDFYLEVGKPLNLVEEILIPSGRDSEDYEIAGMVKLSDENMKHKKIIEKVLGKNAFSHHSIGLGTHGTLVKASKTTLAKVGQETVNAIPEMKHIGPVEKEDYTPVNKKGIPAEAKVVENKEKLTVEEVKVNKEFDFYNLSEVKKEELKRHIFFMEPAKSEKTKHREFIQLELEEWNCGKEKLKGAALQLAKNGGKSVPKIMRETLGAGWLGRIREYNKSDKKGRTPPEKLSKMHSYFNSSKPESKYKKYRRVIFET